MWLCEPGTNGPTCCMPLTDLDTVWAYMCDWNRSKWIMTVLGGEEATASGRVVQVVTSTQRRNWPVFIPDRPSGSESASRNAPNWGSPSRTTANSGTTSSHFNKFITSLVWFISNWLVSLIDYWVIGQPYRFEWITRLGNRKRYLSRIAGILEIITLIHYLWYHFDIWE